jgi:Terminase large subunit, T4likevirus-type, N-terminal
LKIVTGFKPQPGPQHHFLTCPADIVVYGGARGGGKSFASLGEFWCHSEDWGPAAKGLMLRRSREDLKDTIDVARQMYGSAAEWKDKEKQFRFRNGAVFHMAYLENDADAMNYQGWSLTRVYVEELTQYPSSAGIFRLFATLRTTSGARCQFRATCNPGGPGHHWVKNWIIDNGPYRPVKDAETGLIRIFIPAKISDNPALLGNDPSYINRLRASGSPALVRAWLEGDWNIIEGAFFPEFDPTRHVITPPRFPLHWTRFRSMDWGSASPFSIGWWVVVQEDMIHDKKRLPKNAIIRYREWYGAAAPNKGLKLPADAVAKEVVRRETDGKGFREPIAYGIMDPAAFAVVSGPSIGEIFARHGVYFRRADNSRVSTPKRMGGWDQLRWRLIGDEDGDPMIFFVDHCRDSIRTLPMQQHDENRPEDLDTEGEDHAVDDIRYACMSRPFGTRVEADEDLNPLMVRNAFKLDELQ